MVHQTEKPTFEANEQLEFDFYLQWEWPEHIETTLRRLLWISLVELAEPELVKRNHTALLRWQIATYPEASQAVLDFLATDSDPDLQERIAENPQTWPMTLARLAKSPLTNVRIAVAHNENTSIDVLISLAEDPSLDVRYSMAENPALPSKLLRQLSADENPYVACRATRTLARRNPPAVEHMPLRSHRRESKLG